MEDLLKYHGRKFSAKIHNVKVIGKISVTDNIVHLCQNKKSGSFILDSQRFGYEYAWCVVKGHKDQLQQEGITEFSLKPSTAKEIEAYKDWQVGDELDNGKEGLLEVIFRNDELVICKHFDETEHGEATNNFTCTELYNRGWRLVQDSDIKDEQVEVELTMNEIADKFNINVDLLKIKKD